MSTSAQPKTAGQRRQPSSGTPLESYSDDHHGFLRVEVTPTTLTGRYYIVPRPQDPFSKGSHLVDYFEFDWASKKYNPNKL